MGAYFLLLDWLRKPISAVCLTDLSTLGRLWKMDIKLSKMIVIETNFIVIIIEIVVSSRPISNRFSESMVWQQNAAFCNVFILLAFLFEKHQAVLPDLRILDLIRIVKNYQSLRGAGTDKIISVPISSDIFSLVFFLVFFFLQNARVY